MLTISTLAQAAAELTKLTDKQWTEPELLDFASQQLIPLHAVVQIEDKDISSKHSQSIEDVWREKQVCWTLAAVPAMNTRILLLHSTTAVRHPFDGPRDWPVRELPVTIEQVRVKAETLLQIRDAWHNKSQSTDTQPQPVPVPVVEVPDPERRLAALRALGGSDKWKRGRDGVQAWQFTGIQKLVAQEKADRRKRSDEKTIRDDLREAAETERMEKRNPWNK